MKPTYSDQSLTKLSPFAVEKSILGRYGTVKQVKKLKDGSLLIEVEKYIQAQLLLDTQTFLDIEVDAEAHRSFNISKGVIRDHHQDLKDMSDEDIRLVLSRFYLLNLYRSLIRSKLDYGYIVYGSARPSYLTMLNTIHHQGIRLALGAFRTSPVESLYVEAGELPLEERRIKLSLQYLTKLKSTPLNPAIDRTHKLKKTR